MSDDNEEQVADEDPTEVSQEQVQDGESSEEKGDE